ncbi:MAG: hypothetical protein R6V10_03890 [bacterium]
MPKLADLEYKLPDHLLRFAGPEVKKEAKMTAARGMLPLPPQELAQVLFSLTREEDEELRQTASQSLLKMPGNILKNIATDKNTHPLILDFLARNHEGGNKLQEDIALNPSTHDETIVYQAGIGKKEVVDIISQNQARILRRPDIVDELADNPYMGQAQLDRILKFVEMEQRRLDKKQKEEASAKQEAGEEEESGEEEVEEEEIEVPSVTEGEEEIGAVTEGEESPWAAMTFDQELLRDHKVEDEQEQEQVEKSLSKKIMNMKTSEKIKLAMTGGKSARAILIKDANKIVSTSVLKSPKITDNEVEGISRSKSLSDEVIRMVAGNRDWTKSYQVKYNLAVNPKTPVPDAMRFLNHLRDKDLRDIARSRNVPSQVATQAKRIIQRKEQKSKPGAKH